MYMKELPTAMPLLTLYAQINVEESSCTLQINPV